MLACLGAVVALSSLAALLTGQSPLRRILSTLAISAALAVPWILGKTPIVRGVSVYFALMGVMKVWQIATSATTYPWTAGKRIWHALIPLDTRRATRQAAALDLGLLWRGILALLLTAASVWLIIRALATPSNAGLAVALFGVAIFVYGLVEAIAATIRFIHCLFGIFTPAIQRDPILSRSLGEFWSERWNLPVSQWLNAVAFRPLARRGHPVIGIVAAFALSGAIHGWLFLVAVDRRAGAISVGFFFIQSVAVLFETHAGIRHWPTVAARAWTWAVLLVSSPLLGYPLLLGVARQGWLSLP